MTKLHNIYLIVLCTLSLTLQALEPEVTEKIDAYIAEAMTFWNSPGTAIAIVRDGHTVYEKGYGIRAADRDLQPVNEHTLFAIASCSKAFSASIVGLLEERGQLDWDIPVNYYLPEVKFCKEEITHAITFRDIIAHRTGLEKGDLIWLTSGLSLSDLLGKYEFLQETGRFRDDFSYSNLLYSCIGELVTRLDTSCCWNCFLEDNLLAPLEMHDTLSAFKHLNSAGNIVSGHINQEGTLRHVAWRNIDNIGPAGSIVSSAADMAHWISMWLGRGVYKGQRILPEKYIKEALSPQITFYQEFREKLLPVKMNALSYGLGWMIADSPSFSIVEHLGAVEGMTALVCLIPEKDFGIVILTSSHENFLVYSIRNFLIDLLTENRTSDWNERVKIISDEKKRQEQERLDLFYSRFSSHTEKPLADFSPLGFNNPLYGEAILSYSNGELFLEIFNHKGFRLSPLGGNSYKANFVELTPYLADDAVIHIHVDEEKIPIGFDVTLPTVIQASFARKT